MKPLNNSKRRPQVDSRASLTQHHLARKDERLVQDAPRNVRSWWIRLVAVRHTSHQHLLYDQQQSVAQESEDQSLDSAGVESDRLYPLAAYDCSWKSVSRYHLITLLPFEKIALR